MKTTRKRIGRRGGGNNSNSNSNNNSSNRLARTKRNRNVMNSLRNIRTVGSHSYTLSIPLTKILITDPIVKAARTMNPDVIIKGFKRYPYEQGFPLPRVNTIRNANFHNLPIISVEPFKTSSYFTIIDGRHRFAKALAEGRDIIEARVIQRNNI